MRYSLILCILFVSTQACAKNIFPVTVISEYSSSNPFRGVESISLPADGELISNNFFTNDEFFENGNIYKRIHNVFAANLFWPYNSTNHIFTLKVIEASAGARWRQINSLQDGSTYSLGWVNLTTGTNSISLNPVDYDRAIIGFFIDGNIKFDKFTHTFGSHSWGYEEVSVAVPEPSSYSCIAGLFALFLAAKRRR
ncbi:MAG: hypothetical protein VXZ83_06230 [Verrucomicrobiota bacterium]|nr:hypothetical protein [Verrucomicrobiota bacterium]